MTTAQRDLDNFTNYARHVIASGQHDVSIDELFDQWRIENPSDEQYAENVAAVNASIQDYKSGERGSLAGEHSSGLRRKLGVSDE